MGESVINSPEKFSGHYAGLLEDPQEDPHNFFFFFFFFFFLGGGGGFVWGGPKYRQHYLNFNKNTKCFLTDHFYLKEFCKPLSKEHSCIIIMLSN